MARKSSGPPIFAPFGFAEEPNAKNSGGAKMPALMINIYINSLWTASSHPQAIDQEELVWGQNAFASPAGALEYAATLPPEESALLRYYTLDGHAELSDPAPQVRYLASQKIAGTTVETENRIEKKFSGKAFGAAALSGLDVAARIDGFQEVAIRESGSDEEPISIGGGNNTISYLKTTAEKVKNEDVFFQTRESASIASTATGSLNAEDAVLGKVGGAVPGDLFDSSYDIMYFSPQPIEDPASENWTDEPVPENPIADLPFAGYQNVSLKHTRADIVCGNTLIGSRKKEALYVNDELEKITKEQGFTIKSNGALLLDNAAVNYARGYRQVTVANGSWFGMIYAYDDTMNQKTAYVKDTSESNAWSNTHTATGIATITDSGTALEAEAIEDAQEENEDPDNSLYGFLSATINHSTLNFIAGGQQTDQTTIGATRSYKTVDEFETVTTSRKQSSTETSRGLGRLAAENSLLGPVEGYQNVSLRNTNVVGGIQNAGFIEEKYSEESVEVNEEVKKESIGESYKSTAAGTLQVTAENRATASIEGDICGFKTVELKNTQILQYADEGEGGNIEGGNEADGNFFSTVIAEKFLYGEMRTMVTTQTAFDSKFTATGNLAATASEIESAITGYQQVQLNEVNVGSAITGGAWQESSRMEAVEVDEETVRSTYAATSKQSLSGSLVARDGDLHDDINYFQNIALTRVNVGGNIEGANQTASYLGAEAVNMKTVGGVPTKIRTLSQKSASTYVSAGSVAMTGETAQFSLLNGAIIGYLNVNLTCVAATGQGIAGGKKSEFENETVLDVTQNPGDADTLVRTTTTLFGESTTATGAIAITGTAEHKADIRDITDYQKVSLKNTTVENAINSGSYARKDSQKVVTNSPVETERRVVATKKTLSAMENYTQSEASTGQLEMINSTASQIGGFTKVSISFDELNLETNRIGEFFGGKRTEKFMGKYADGKIEISKRIDETSIGGLSVENARLDGNVDGFLNVQFIHVSGEETELSGGNMTTVRTFAASDYDFDAGQEWIWDQDTRTMTAKGTADLDHSTVYAINGYAKVILENESSVLGDILIPAPGRYEDEEGVYDVICKQNGSLFISDSSVGGSVIGYKAVKAQRGENHLGNYVGTAANDIVTVDAGAKLEIDGGAPLERNGVAHVIDFGAGNDKLVVNGGFRTMAAFAGLETIAGSGTLVLGDAAANALLAAINAGKTKVQLKEVINAGAEEETVAAFAGVYEELSDNTAAGAKDLFGVLAGGEEYDGWLCGNREGLAFGFLDEVDYFQFGLSGELPPAIPALNLENVGADTVELTRDGGVVDIAAYYTGTGYAFDFEAMAAGDYLLKVFADLETVGARSYQMAVAIG
jgi:hypothetical protein